MRLLRVLVFAAFCVSATVTLSQSQGLPPMPSQKGFNWKSQFEAWEEYSRIVLEYMFPTRRKLVERVKIHIVDDETINARGGGNDMLIAVGLIKFVRNEDEFAAVLAHELGHRLLVHRSPLRPPETLAEDIEASREHVVNIISNWAEYQRNEVEADTISMLMARQPKAPFVFYARVSSEVFGVDLPESGYALRQFQIMKLRIQTMNNILDQVDLAPVVRAKPLPKLPSWKAEADAWVSYGRDVLYAMFPNYEGRVARLRLRIDEDAPLAHATVGPALPEGMIELNIKFVHDVVRSPEEFAVLIGHEFGHIVMTRYYAGDYNGTGIAFGEAEINFRKEFEADLFATLPLEKGDCTLTRVLERVVVNPLTFVEFPLDLDQPRLNRLRAQCALNR